jgi:hypothetical protein
MKQSTLDFIRQHDGSTQAEIETTVHKVVGHSNYTASFQLYKQVNTGARDDDK